MFSSEAGTREKPRSPGPKTGKGGKQYLRFGVSTQKPSGVKRKVRNQTKPGEKEKEGAFKEEKKGKSSGGEQHEEEGAAMQQTRRAFEVKNVFGGDIRTWKRRDPKEPGKGMFHARGFGTTNQRLIRFLKREKTPQRFVLRERKNKKESSWKTEDCRNFVAQNC